MTKLIHILKDYIATTFNLKLYLSIAALLTVVISINYSLNFEKEIINSFYGSWERGALIFFVEYIPYLIACGFISIFTQTKGFFKKKGFWFSGLFIFGLMALERGAYFEKYAADFSSGYEYIFYFKLIGNLEPLFLIIVPLIATYLIYDRTKIGHCYGLQTKNVDLKPYFIMFGIMVIPIFLAALTDDFQEAYPKAEKAKYLEFATINGISSTTSFLYFEIFYLLSFIAVELIYRGVMIYKMEKYLGDYVVLPMVVVYAILHFGKPIGETLGSIGGAYILGILALRTKNIYGGIAIHMGVAFLMEIFAFMAKS